MLFDKRAVGPLITIGEFVVADPAGKVCHRQKAGANQRDDHKHSCDGGPQRSKQRAGPRPVIGLPCDIVHLLADPERRNSLRRSG